jgi:hypothetical protein
MTTIRAYGALSLVVAASLVAGCYMGVKVDSGADSPYDSLHASVVAYSRPGEGFDERKEKDVYISVSRRGVEPAQYLFTTETRIVASSLDWNIKWKSKDEVVIELFEYPAGASRWSDAAVKRQVQTIPLKTLILERVGESFLPKS